MNHLQPLITIVSTISAGIFCIILADRIKLPSILFLLVTGVCLGPHGFNLIQPSVFKNELPQYITLLVALILFEGGTYLRFEQLKDISRPLRNLLSIGMLISLIATSFGAHWILHMSWTKSILFGSILIVTGPTVVQPILQRIRIKEKIHNILKWESILIDPLGVITAIVLSEILLIDYIGPLQGLALLAARISIGLTLGFIAGRLMFFFLSRQSLLRFENEELSGIFILGVTLLFYGISESILSESGMVTATVAGIVFGNSKLANIETILRFKKQLTLVALSVIFILLSAYMPIDKIQSVIKPGTFFLLFLIFIVRPLSVFLSTFNEKSMTFQEKLFLCFFAPRGIVSAVLASLLTILFEEKELIGQGIFLPSAFYIIVGSIIFYSITGRITAKALNLIEDKGKSVLIIGITQPLTVLAEILRDFGFPVIFIDTNPDLCQKMKSKGFAAFHGSGTDKNFLESIDLKGVHQMIAATPNSEANILACQLITGYLGKKTLFRSWDNHDTWDNSNLSNHEHFGRPLIFTSAIKQISGKIDLKNNISKNKLSAPITMNQQYLRSVEPSLPLFAINNNSLILLTPNISIPAGSEIISIQLKSI